MFLTMRNDDPSLWIDELPRDPESHWLVRVAERDAFALVEIVVDLHL